MELEVGDLRPEAADSRGKVGVEVLLADELPKRSLRIGVRDDNLAPDLRAVGEANAAALAALDDDSLDLGVGPDLGAEAGGGVGHRLGDHPHATFWDSGEVFVLVFVGDVDERVADVGNRAADGPRVAR